MRVANRALKTAIANVESLASIDDVFTLRDAGRYLGVARSTIARWSDEGIFVAKSFGFEGKKYRYYTRKQVDEFAQTEFYTTLPVGSAKIYAKISTTIHDFDVGVTETVFTPAEFAEKLGVSLQTLNRMDRSGQFVANRVCKNNRTYRYYTQTQYDLFIESGMQTSLNHVRNADLIGARIGKLVILSYSESAAQKWYYGSYLCQCDCGNIVEIPRSELLAGKAKSCGCKFHDLTGKNFGWWHVDGPAPFGHTTNGQKVFRYYCTCVCGRKSIVFASSLRQGYSQSCGCRVEPIGEAHIRRYLNTLGLYPLVDDEDGYIQHSTYADLLGIGGNRLSYDFYVKRDGQEWFIEYQGQQHYYPVEYFGGEAQFKVQQEHDHRKRAYAQKRGIPLIEISYEYATYEDVSLALKKAGIV